MATLASSLADLYRRLHYTTTPNTDTTTRLTAFLNETHREILSAPGMDKLRDDTMTATALASTFRTALPPVVSRIMGITDRGNNRVLRQVTPAEIRMMDPALASTGSAPEVFAVAGRQQVRIQPTAATGLWMVSSSTSDTTQTGYAETVTTGGYGYRDSKALNGTTRVQLGAVATRTDHVIVEKFYLSATCVGYISLYDAAAAGNELARIEPGQTFAAYLAVEWWPVQTADVTVYVDFQREIFDLVNSTDEWLLPRDFHWLVVRGALSKEYEFTTNPAFAASIAMYQVGLKSLFDYVLNNGDKLASLRPISSGFNDLTGIGSGYPDSQRFAP